MKILLSAFECNPLFGSDLYVGWSWVSNMAKINDVYVLLRKDHKPYIDSYCSKNVVEKIENIHFIYLKSSNFWGKIIYKFNKQFAVVGQYYIWQKLAYKTAYKLHKTEHFDIAHVVSIADFRFPGYLWKLEIPYIFGPVGGAQETPDSLKFYIKGHEKSERFRTFMNRFLIGLPNYKKALTAADIIYCSNIETENVISRCIGTQELHKIYRLTELGIGDSYLEARKNLLHTQSDKVHILVSGRLIYRKGIELLLDVVEKINTKIPFIVDIYGEGEQSDFLKAKNYKLGLENTIFFHGKISFVEMQEKYKEADIYCLPSLRETTGTSVFEAMANKLPVIALNQNGVKDIVEDDCGILIHISNREQIIREFAAALKYMIENPNMRQIWGNTAYYKILNKYTWTKKIIQMNKVYESLVKTK